MKDLGIRVVSGLIGLVLLIFIIMQGGNTLRFAIMIISIIGLYEFYNALKKKEYEPFKFLGYLSTVLYYFLGRKYLGLFITFSIMGSLLALLSNKYNINDIALTIVSILYIPFLFSHIFLLEGTSYIWLIFIIAFGTDTFAYFAGNLFGKNKLCPDISPNKTIEGFLGGIIGSVLLTYVYNSFIMNLNFIKLIPLSILGSIISQTGDLVASSIKRYTGIKDYGNLIPGHGGILDRFDSIIFTAPIVYYYIEIFLI